MARLDTGTWYKIDFNFAHFITECCGFIQKPFDLWDMETKEYFHQKSDLSFNFKIGNTDTISFLIQPYLGEKSLSLEQFKEELKKMGKEFKSHEESREMEFAK